MSKHETYNLFKYLEGNVNLLLDNIQGKKVLVLGSGPSATDIDWVKKDWEVLVTTSFFYLVPEILEQKPIHVTLSDLVDLRDEKLINYLDENPLCTIAFEPKKHPFYDSRDDESGYIKFKEKYKDRLILYNIEKKIGGKEGVAGRVCWPVLAAGPKSLMICGIDGMSKNPKKDPPNYFRGHQGTPDYIENKGGGGYSYKTYKSHFNEFGNRLYKVAKEHNISVENLGKGKPYNMITSASLRHGDTFDPEKMKITEYPERAQSRLEKTAFIVQARTNSERVPNKMLKKFADTNLFELILKKLLKSKIIPQRQIYASVYEKELKKVAENLDITRYDRSNDSANNDNKLKKIYEWHDKLKPQYEYVVLISGCNPLLKVETIDRFVNQFLKQKKENLFAVVEKKQYYWNKEGKMITPWPEGQTIMNTKAVEPTYEAAHVL